MMGETDWARAHHRDMLDREAEEAALAHAEEAVAGHDAATELEEQARREAQARQDRERALMERLSQLGLAPPQGQELLIATK